MRTYLIGGGLLTGGLVIAVLLIVLQPAPAQAPPASTAPVVTTTTAEAQDGALSVRSFGTVQPAIQVDLTAEVSGRIVEVAPSFVSGGAFRAGDVLARIDPADYESQVQQARAQVTQAEFEVLQAREEVAVARAEFAQLQQRGAEELTPDSTALGRLIFREPQLRLAEANAASARAALATAETNLRRTRLTAPFNGRVRLKQADRGAFVGAGTPVATLFGTDVVEVRVPLESRKAALIPDLWQTRPTDEAGPPVTVQARYGEQTYTWNGTVDRVEGALDEETRTIDVLVRVPNPYRAADDRPPLAVGTYVSVAIEGQRLEGYFALPRRAVREDNQLWTVADDSVLVMRPATVVQTADGTAYLTADIPEGTPIITSDLSVVTDSMTVRLQN